MMEAVQTSETLVNSYHSTWCCNLEDLHTHCCENLKSYILDLDFFMYNSVVLCLFVCVYVFFVCVCLCVWVCGCGCKTISIMSLVDILVIMYSLSVPVVLSVKMTGIELFLIVAIHPLSLWYLELL
jgi:hypothetical protein